MDRLPHAQFETLTGVVRPSYQIFFRKRRFSSGDVCEVALVPPPAGDRGGATGGFEAELGNVEFCYEWVMVTNLIQSLIVYDFA